MTSTENSDSDEQEPLGWKILRHFMLFLAVGWLMPFIWLYQWFKGFEGLSKQQAARREKAGIAVILLIAVVIAAGLINKEFRYL